VRITNVLRAKGSVIALVPSDALVTVMLAQMTKHRVPAVVVVDDGAVMGMVWEHDVIRSCANAELHSFRPALETVPT
jgi:CBS domain-containing protein